MSNKNMDELMENIVMTDELKNKIREKTVYKKVKYRRTSMKRVLLVASLCVATFGAMTVVASNNAEKIEHYFMNILGYDTDMQKELEKEGFYQKMEQGYNEGDIISATNDGITVEIKETIVDKNVAKALIQIRAENRKLDEDCYVDKWYVTGTNKAGEAIEYSSLIGTPIKGTENLEGNWYIVNINDASGNTLKTGDTVEIKMDDLLLTKWNTEILCELKDGETVVINEEEYVVKKVGHNDECNHKAGEIYDEDCFCNKYHSIWSDLDEYAYVFVSTSTGDEYASGDLYVRHSRGGCFLVRRIDDSVERVSVSNEEWVLKWTLTVSEECIQIPINDTIEANELYYHIDNVQVTPFSFNVTFSKNAEGSLQYKPLDIKFYLEDGSVYECDKAVALITGHHGEWYSLDEVLDWKSIEKISIEGEEYNVSE